MRAADRRDDRNIRIDDARQRRNLARRVHPHLTNEILVARLGGEDRQRDTDRVVVRADRGGAGQR